VWGFCFCENENENTKNRTSSKTICLGFLSDFQAT